MKKALALVLALVLALSLGVSAFALEVVDLASDAAQYKDGRLNLDNYSVSFTGTGSERVLRADAEGGTFYMLLNEDGMKLKDIEVVANGCVSAKVVDFDPATMKTSKVGYKLYVGDAAYDDYGALNAVPTGASKTRLELINEKLNPKTLFTADDIRTSYVLSKALADMLTSETKGATKYAVKTISMDAADYGAVVDYKVIVLEIEPNYTVAYKEGSFKIKATDVTDKKAPKSVVSPEYVVISDVTIFEYEEVKWAADGHVLEIGVEGYSDYETALYGYKDANGDYSSENLRKVDGATVVSTTAFRAIQGKKLVVGIEGDENYSVTIKEVAAGQKGVNFAYDGIYTLNKAGYDVRWPGVTDKNVVSIEFGFLGNQKIASDFVISLVPTDGQGNGINYFDLREVFGEKVEEEDVITYYILKDGEKYGEFTVDYLDTELAFSNVELEINGKAGDTLGWYSIVLEAPAAPSEGEENPNTGAESVIGVVAAMAVVSVAAAAAVSLKK